LNESCENSVTVKHVPLTAMLSPRCTSSRMAAALEIVSDVPPPPVAVESSGTSAETAFYKHIR
jgi:hypothetical protein